MPSNDDSSSNRLKVLLLIITLIAALVLLVYMSRTIYQALTDNLEDFYEYYIAANGFRQGVDVYAIRDMAGWEKLAALSGVPTFAPPYRYPPLLAVMIMPLLSLPPRLAGFLWTAISMIVLTAALTLISDVLPKGRKRLPWIWIIAAVFLPVLSTLYSGQVNNFVLFSIALALWAFKRGHPVGSGLALAFGIMIKLVPITLLAYFLWRWQWRVVIGAIAGIILLSLICVPFVGWDVMWSYGQHMMFNADPQILQVNPLNQSLLGCFGRLFTSYPWGTGLLDNPGMAWNLGRGLGLVLVAATFLLCWPGRPLQPLLLEEVSVVIIATLLLPSISWYHLLTLLLIPILTLLWGNPDRPNQRTLSRIAIACIIVINLQGILWIAFIRQPLLLSLATYATLILWVTLAWELFKENRRVILARSSIASRAAQ